MTMHSNDAMVRNTPNMIVYDPNTVSPAPTSFSYTVRKEDVGTGLNFVHSWEDDLIETQKLGLYKDATFRNTETNEIVEITYTGFRLQNGLRLICCRVTGHTDLEEDYNIRFFNQPTSEVAIPIDEFTTRFVRVVRVSVWADRQSGGDATGAELVKVNGHWEFLEEPALPDSVDLRATDVAEAVFAFGSYSVYKDEYVTQADEICKLEDDRIINSLEVYKK